VKYLSDIGYYKLINGYKKPFIEKSQNGCNKFIDSTSITDLYYLYCFDKGLRELLLRYLNSVEVSIKAKMAEHMSKNFGIKENDYLNPNNYKTNQHKPFIDIQTKVLSAIKEQVDKQNAIRHYSKNYGYFPFWVVSNILTFGHICHLYSKMKQPDQYCISKNFNVKAEWLESAMIVMQLFRNACAHNEIVYSFKTVAYSLNQNEWNDLYKTFNISKDPKTGKYEKGVNDLLAIFFIFKLVLDKAEFLTFISQFESIRNKLKSKVNAKVYERIVELMAIPNDIEKVKNMKRS
jgi:abortive infection bacteriophage resistance protein